jgi:hypothetical protein
MVKTTLLALLAPLRWLVRLVLALIILFEEWGWEPLQRAMAWLGRLPVLRQLEAAIRRLPPYAALVLVLLPTLLAVPIKLLAVWLISIGRAGLGLVLILAVKVIGTAILARLFVLTQPALLQISWFARFYARWTRWKAGLLAWVHSSAAWQWVQAFKLRIKALLRRPGS